jgi:pimeloyl-ACP methyl ester carboxylesterase
VPNIQGNGLCIEYETFGDRQHPAVLLIMGLGAQMIFWEDDFCRAIADHGFHVIRFDNRDCGLSTHFHDAGTPNVVEAMTAALSGASVASPYRLSDMAADAIALLDALGIARAHVVGASMGGMIAQTIAVEHPRRVLSLTSIMSSTGNPQLPPAKPEAMTVLLTPAPSERQAFIDHMVKGFRVIGSPGFEFDEKSFRDRIGRAYDRSYDRPGVARQLVAVLADGSRKERLAAVHVPTVVIHGKDDPLVPVEAAKDTADAIPGARLVVIDGMGHDLPRGTWPRIIDEITQVALRSGTRAASV